MESTAPNTAERDPGHLQNWVKEGQATLVEVWCRCTGSGTILSGPEKYCLGSFHAAFKVLLCYGPRTCRGVHRITLTIYRKIGFKPENSTRSLGSFAVLPELPTVQRLCPKRALALAQSISRPSHSQRAGTQSHMSKMPRARFYE